MRAASILAATVLTIGCVTELHRSKQPVAVDSLGAPSTGPSYALVVGTFQNRSQYLQGAFADGADPLGAQAKTLLEMHLKLTSRFVVVDRARMDEMAFDAALRGEPPSLAGAQVAITGEVTQFGRRQKQIAHATVALKVVDVNTARVTYAVQGTGEYPLADREAPGFGTLAGHDASLNGKVLNLAIREAVDNLMAGLDRGEWSPMPSGVRDR